MQQIQPPPVESDIVLKQLQKTQENISLWGLLMASYEHRHSLLKLLSCIQVPTDINLEALVRMVGSIQSLATIMFIDKDLPNQGQHHFQALYITLDMKEKRVPMVLIDNESALNEDHGFTKIKLSRALCTKDAIITIHRDGQMTNSTTNLPILEIVNREEVKEMFGFEYEPIHNMVLSELRTEFSPVL
ncbi:retropepsin-like aspartic protease [Fagus crenata]